MSKILVIVESPAKCAKIAGFLRGLMGNNYTVKASFGHFRDLAKDSVQLIQQMVNLLQNMKLRKQK